MLRTKLEKWEINNLKKLAKDINKLVNEIHLSNNGVDCDYMNNCIVYLNVDCEDLIDCIDDIFNFWEKR